MHKSSVPTGGKTKTTPRSEAVALARTSVTNSAPQPSQPDKSVVATQVLEIIAEEVGLEKSELVPSSSFADLGVDSLLSLNIAGRLREELVLEVDGSLFADCLTIIDLMKALDMKETPSSAHESTIPPTPKLDSASATSDDDNTDDTSLDGDETDIMSIIRRTIAKEAGIAEKELTGSLDLNELGMDSLLSLTILGKLRDELEIEVPASLFADNTSLNEVKAALGLEPEVAAPPYEKVCAPLAKKDSPNSEGIPVASSVLLQGTPKSATKTLFLFPDGSGSATSYSPIPPIAPDIVVYGLNCPYMRTPQDMKCSIEAVTPRYLQEIRRRQPNGPYYFGGWSAGGICAFDAAQQLDRVGERVERLILIDSPFPIGLEKLPSSLYDFFKTIGLFGAGDTPPPPWLLPHFLAFVDSLDLYKAKPFLPGRSPPSRLIWARDGVCKFHNSPRPDMSGASKEMKWLLNNRTDFSSNGWDSLLSSDTMVIETMDDANHFTMMAGEKVKQLTVFIRKAMD